MKDYRNIVILFLLLAMIFTMLTVIASANGKPTTGARALALLEPQTGTFLMLENADTPLPMASTTKIMTALLAIENCELDELVTIPKEAVGIEGSSLYLKEDDVLSVRALVYSVLLQSANDASVALALKLGGDLKGFSEIMNQKARELGLSNTHFDNPHGLDSEEHYTSARDLALLTREALSNDTFRRIASTYKYSFSLGDSVRTVVNHNKMLKRYDGAIGVKTGFTKRSGRCLVSAAEREGLSLIAVTLDDPDDWRDHTAMLDYGFSLMEAVSLDSLNASSFNLKILDGECDSVIVEPDTDYPYIIRLKSDIPLRAEVLLPKYKAAPVCEGEAVGRILIYNGNDVIQSIELVSKQTVEAKRKQKSFPWF